MNKRIGLILIATTLFIPHIKGDKAPQKTILLNVFVHGIMSIKPHLSIDNFFKFMNDRILNTLYAKTVEYMRNDPFFNLSQISGDFGLHEVNSHNIGINKAPNGIAKIYNDVSQMIGDGYENRFYTFGWSGLMSPTSRYYDGHELFLALEQEIDRIQKTEGITPHIRLIGYSHGGNVCLNLAAIARDFYPNNTLTIDELILLAVPLVTETDYLVASPFFKKVYNIISTKDRIQRIDFFSFNRLFSRKYLQSRRGFSIPSNVAQLQIKLMRPIKTKKYSEKRREILRHDFSNPSIVSGSSHLLRDCSPGHIEFWFFGWTPQHYRSDFILNPLPILVFLPYILYNIQQCEQLLTNPEPIVIDIRPDDQVTLIKQPSSEFLKVIDFFDNKQLEKLKDVAYVVKPNNYGEEEFNKHIQMAVDKAKKYHKIHVRPYRRLQIRPKKQVRLRMPQLHY